MLLLPLSNDDTLPKIAGVKRLESVNEAMSWPQGKDVEHKIATKMFTIHNYRIQLSKPGKEAAPSYELCRYKDGTLGNNPNDMRPEIVMNDRLIEKNATFRDIFDELQKIHLQSIPGIRLVACLMARSAFLADHKEIAPGIWRYHPPVEAMNALKNLIPTAYDVPIEVFMHYLDALALNEDTKYHTLGYKISEGYGRKNNLLTCVHLIGVLTGDISIADFAGNFSRPPSGVSPISKKKMWEVFPELAEV